MKKLGIIVALALIVTVGGVYATWNYTVANNKVDAVDTKATITLTAKTEIQLESGTITVNPSGLSVEVDDKGDHTAVLKITGNIVVSFTGKDDDNNARGIALKCSASDDCGEYNGSAVFKYTDLTSGFEVTDTNTWTISADDLSDLIQLNGTISAPTSDDYDALSTAISGKTITLTFDAVG